MRGLRDTTAGLALIRNAMKHQSENGDDAGLHETRRFGLNPGGLRMLTYVPRELAPNAALVVVLHGCTQRAGSHARAAGWLTLADRLGFAVLAPEQDTANNPNRCFNWFEPADTARGSGEAASIHAMVQQMLRAHALDPARVFITGLSAGGAMTSVLLATYPETFAAGAVVAGLPFGLAKNMREAFDAMRGGASLGSRELGARVTRAAPAPPRKPRLAIWHGQADGTVASSNASALARQWAAFHGLSAEPAEVQARPGWTRSVWRASDGEAVIEMNLLAGLGHGTPLAAVGDDPIGELAPFMLEAGVSSSLEIARFWGLAPAEQPSSATEWSAAARAPEAAEAGAQGLGEHVMTSVSPHVAEDVRRVIAKALAFAGLMDRQPPS
jgi:poly(hydroxyalkanoate) depolymerase family esterase